MHTELVHLQKTRHGGGSSQDEVSEELSPGVLSAESAPCVWQVLVV